MYERGINGAERAKLIEALRSGQFRQIRGRFEDGEGFCAVGLAWHLGLRHALVGPESGMVMVLNDSGASFEEIADRLERGDLVASYEPPADYPPWGTMAVAEAMLKNIQQADRERHAGLAEPEASRREFDDDDGPPPTPAVIFIYPRRPVLSSAASRPRLFGAAGRQLLAA